MPRNTQAWDAAGTPYKAFVDGLKKGRDAAFCQRAAERRPALDALYEKLGEDHARSGAVACRLSSARVEEGREDAVKF